MARPDSPYLEYLLNQVPALRAAQAQAQAQAQPPPNPAMANMVRMAAQQAMAQRMASRPPVPSSNTQVAAPIPQTRYGDTIRSVGGSQPQQPYRRPLPAATPQQALGLAQLGQRQPDNMGSVVADPRFQDLVQNGMDPATAYRLILREGGQQQDYQAVQQTLADAPAQIAASNPGGVRSDVAGSIGAAAHGVQQVGGEAAAALGGTPLFATPGGPVGTLGGVAGAGARPAAQAVGTTLSQLAGTPFVAVGTGDVSVGELSGGANDVLQKGTEAFENAQADAVYGAVLKGRESGWTDRQILDTLKPGVNPLMWGLPVGRLDSDEAVTQFFNNLIFAYEHGYTAYGSAPRDAGEGYGGVQLGPVVGHWGPGAKAAHEFLAGEQNWEERTYNAVALDPSNYVLPATGRGGAALAEAGESIAARGGSWGTFGRLVTAAGDVVAAPNTVLNAIPDKVIEGGLSRMGSIIGRAPVVGAEGANLTGQPDRIAGQAAQEDTAEALQRHTALSDNPTGSTTTDIGGVPQPPVPPDSSTMLGPGGNPLTNVGGYIGPMPPPGTDSIPPLPTSIVGPGGQGIQYGPNAYPDPETAGLRDHDFGDDAVPGQPTVYEPDFDTTTVADEPAETVTTPEPEGVTTPDQPTEPTSEPSADPYQADPELAAIPINRRLPTDLMDSAQRTMAIKQGRISSLTPVRKGERVIDEAWRLGDTDPQGWEDFKASYKPKVDRYKVKAEYLENNTWFPTVDAKAINQVAAGIKHTVDDVVPSFVDAYHRLPDIKVLSKPSIAPEDRVPLLRKDGTQRIRNGKPAFAGTDYNLENPNYLMERYVYQADDADAANIMRVLRDSHPKTANAPWADRLLNDLEKARADLADLRTRVPDRPTETTFTTAKGSTYRVTENGTTIRDKAPRPEHPGEAGIQPESQATVYVAPDDAVTLGEFQTQGGPTRRVALVDEDHVGVQYVDGPSAGKFERRTVVPITRTPAVGTTPVEWWNDGERVHFGNPITEVDGVPAAADAPTPDAVSDGAQTPVGAAETAPTETTTPAGYPVREIPGGRGGNPLHEVDTPLGTYELTVGGGRTPYRATMQFRFADAGELHTDTFAFPTFDGLLQQIDLNVGEALRKYPDQVRIPNAQWLRENAPRIDPTAVGFMLDPKEQAQRLYRATTSVPQETPLLPEGARQANPHPQLADREKGLLDYRFTGARDAAFKDKNVIQVRDSFVPGVEADQQELQLLQALGAEQAANPVPRRKPAGKRTTLETRGPRGGVKKRPVAGVAADATAAEASDEAEAAKRYADLLLKYAHYGDIVTDSPTKIANEMAAEARKFDQFPHVADRPNLALDLTDALVRRLQRHLLLAFPGTSLPYQLRNIIGNAQLSAMTGNFDGIFRSLQDSAKVLAKGEKGYDETASLAARANADAGFGLPRQYTKASVYGAPNDVIGVGAHTPTRELFDKLKIGRFVAGKFDNVRAKTEATDRIWKLGNFPQIFERFTAEQIPEFAHFVNRMGVKKDVPITRAEWETMFFELRKPESGQFSADDAYDAVVRFGKERGMTQGEARNLAKPAADRWTNLIDQARQHAIEETNRIFPSHRRMTNLDRYASYAMLFHFWPTRTAKLVLEEMIRHPNLIRMWMEARDGLERMAEEGNYPDSVKMLMYIADSPFGFALYANPASLYLVTALDPRPDAPDAQGATRVGKVLKHIRDTTGLAVHPFLDAALNVAGVYGDAFPPNPWPSQTFELAGAAIDDALVRMGHGPGTPVYDNAMAKLRSWGSGIIPGTTNVPYRDQSTYTLDIVGSLLLDQNPDLAARIAAGDQAAREEFARIMANHDDPRYQRAERDVADQKLATQVINRVSPLSITAKIENREFAVQDSRAGFAAQDAGQEPSPLQEEGMNLRDAANSTPEDNVLRAQQGQFEDLGTDRQQALHDGWTSIAYPDATGTVETAFGRIPASESGITIAGQWIPLKDVAALDESERQDLADLWVREQGGTEELAAFRTERKDFTTAHPEYADYASYRGTVFDQEEQPGGIKAWRETRAKANPNFKRSMEAERADLAAKGTNKTVIEAELDRWAASVDGYQAAQGIRGSLYDPDPIGTGDQATVDTLIKSLGGSGAGSAAKPGKTTAAKLTDDLAEYERDNRIVTGILKDYGIDLGPGGFANVNSPYAQDSLGGMLGDLMPKETKLMRMYAEWKALPHPPGTDTSPAAFGKLVDQLADEAAAA